MGSFVLKPEAYPCEKTLPPMKQLFLILTKLWGLFPWLALSGFILVWFLAWQGRRSSQVPYKPHTKNTAREPIQWSSVSLTKEGRNTLQQCGNNSSIWNSWERWQEVVESGFWNFVNGDFFPLAASILCLGWAGHRAVMPSVSKQGQTFLCHSQQGTKKF